MGTKLKHLTVWKVGVLCQSFKEEKLRYHRYIYHLDGDLPTLEVIWILATSSDVPEIDALVIPHIKRRTDAAKSIPSSNDPPGSEKTSICWCSAGKATWKRCYLSSLSTDRRVATVWSSCHRHHALSIAWGKLCALTPCGVFLVLIHVQL